MKLDFMRFSEHFTRDAMPARRPQQLDVFAPIESKAEGIFSFFSEHGGASFGDGIYRVLPAAVLGKWTENVSIAFPQFRDRILCFAFDWLGRGFALDFSRLDCGQCLVLMLEPGTGEAYEIPATFLEFHNQELVDFRDAAVASNLYKEWRSCGGQAPLFGDCVGYKTPLFLGGADDVSNFEIVDLDVYWTLLGQLLSATRNLPDGTEIRNVSIED